jgi:hypothetical protein
MYYQGRICREANEGSESGPVTGMGPFQGPGRGSSNVFPCYVSLLRTASLGLLCDLS